MNDDFNNVEARNCCNSDRALFLERVREAKKHIVASGKIFHFVVNSACFFITLFY